jgi:hypothetical protein
MSRIMHSLDEWTAYLERAYPGVRINRTKSHPPGLNAVAAGILVGRYHSQRDPAFGVVYDQPRSCGGRN